MMYIATGALSYHPFLMTININIERWGVCETAGLVYPLLSQPGIHLRPLCRMRLQKWWQGRHVSCWLRRHVRLLAWLPFKSSRMFWEIKICLVYTTRLVITSRHSVNVVLWTTGRHFKVLLAVLGLPERDLPKWRGCHPPSTLAELIYMLMCRLSGSSLAFGHSTTPQFLWVYSKDQHKSCPHLSWADTVCNPSPIRWAEWERLCWDRLQKAHVHLHIRGRQWSPHWHGSGMILPDAAGL